MIKRNIKMRVTPEQSKQVQEICFANGISWDMCKSNISHIHQKYLFINKKFLTYCDTEEFFKEKKSEEVDANLYIRTQGTCVEDTPEQELTQNNKEETMEKNEVESYADVKEYLITKGLYEDVLSFDIDFNGYLPCFGNMFWFKETPQGHEFWNKINSELVKLKINDKINEILEDYKVRKLEVIETKPKQYLCYVQGKALPKHIHKTLEQAKQEAQRLCRKELAKVSVLEVVAEYEAEVLVKEVL